MSLKILCISATSAEADSMRKMPGIVSSSGSFKYGGHEIDLLIAGVGSMSTAWAMKQWLSSNSMPDLAINAGIAGSYNALIRTGEVVMPVSDCFADSGIENGKSFLTLAEAGMSDADRFPFNGGFLIASNKFIVQVGNQIKPVRAITVNTATGNAATIEKLINKYNPDIETMEGATFFYICAMEKIPFLGIRAISNMVESRDKSNWDIPLALNNLTLKLKDIILTLK